MKRGIILLLIFSFAVFNVVYSQGGAEKLKTAKSLYKQALTLAANIFDEDNYDEALEQLNEAERLFNKNEKPEDVQKAIDTSIDLFNKAIEKSKVLNSSFTEIMKIRQLALDANSPEAAKDQWEDGEDNFKSAVEEYNDKDMENYQKYVKKAEGFYKDAELVGIKKRFSNNLNLAINQAEDKGIKNFAAITLEKSKQLGKEIEALLDVNRYDTLKARSFFNKALYELDHGLYLMDLFKKMDEKDQTMEDLVLSWEEPLIKIASEFKINPAFDRGYDDVTNQIVKNIKDKNTALDKLQKDNQKLSADLDDAKKSNLDYKNRLADSEIKNKQLVASLDSLNKSFGQLNTALEESKNKLAQMESENIGFKTQSEEMAKNQQIIDQVSKLFLPSEAEIVRNDDLIIIRLINIAFPSNKATLEPQYFNLLTKVQKAIQMFPNGSVVIEGHTDGQGNYQQNIDLSQARANAVFQYLMSTMGTESNRITVIGLGSTKPIANNATDEGRAKNRRLEIVINPNFTTK
jgi:outer membrane protein OmpA-like peptidoglycan-associated protein